MVAPPRPVAPERLLRALLMQALHTIRSERQLMEQLDFNLLFRWFVGLGVDDPVWDATVFCKNRDRLLEAAVSAKLLKGVIEHGQGAPSVDPGAFLGGRDADRGLGVDEVVPAQGWRGRQRPGPGPQPRAGLPRREALEREP